MLGQGESAGDGVEVPAQYGFVGRPVGIAVAQLFDGNAGAFRLGRLLESRGLKTRSIECKAARNTRCCWRLVWAANRKSSTYTLPYASGGCRGAQPGRAKHVFHSLGAESVGGVLARASIGCGDRGADARKVALRRSQTVSVTAVKKGGLSTQPIGRATGRATKGSPAVLVGRMTPKLGTL